MSKPDFIAYSVKDKGHNVKPYWHRIGAAWANKEGNGFTIDLESLPLEGRIVLLSPKAEAAASTDGY